jgi:dihydroorotase
MAFKCEEILNDVSIEPFFDLHAHLRNSLADGDGRMEMNLRHALHHQDVLVHIGNGSPPILNQATADQELVKALMCKHDAEREDSRCNETLLIYAGALMTDCTTPEMIFETRERQPRSVLFWKAFLSGVSNDGGNSVTDFKRMYRTLEAFYVPWDNLRPMVLHIHAERKFTRSGRRISMPDREWYAIRTDIEELLVRHPLLEVNIKHVSDWRTIEQIKKWRARGYKVYAEICPHYLYRCHEDLYEGPDGGTAFNLHDLCWPLYKNEKSMRALREAVLSGADWVMMGRDWACHNDDPARSSGVKVNNDGIVMGGVTLLPAVANSLIIDLFVDAGRIENINPYISANARRVHGLPQATTLWRYDRLPWKIPEVITGAGPEGKSLHAKPFMRGQIANWQKYVPSEL